MKGEKDSGLKYLDTALTRDEQSVTFVEEDQDWQEFLEDRDFIELLNRYR